VRPVYALLIYLSSVLIGAALLAPWIWHGVQLIAAQYPAWEGLAEERFHRYVNRCMLVLALVGVWPLIRSLQIRSWTELGWRSPSQALPEMGRGAVVGLISLGFIAVIACLSGARTLNPDPTLARWLSRMVSALLTAVVVSVLEELLFRGAIFSAIRRAHTFFIAALVSSSLYAFVHFFHRPPRPDEVTAWTGLLTLGQMLNGFVDPHLLIPGWINLGLAGWILACARERTGQLSWSIGLHAGWIFWLKIYGFATHPTEDSSWIGTGKMTDGWLATAVLGILAVWMMRGLWNKDAISGAQAQRIKLPPYEEANAK